MKINASMTASEKALLKRLNTPGKIQEFIDGLPYRAESSYCSPRKVMKERRAHCFDGALFGAAALRFIGYPPLLVDLRANDDDDDHILAVFRKNGYYGAVAKSNFVGLRFREPICRNLRELVLSYFEAYYNLNGDKTLREYSAPLDLRKFDNINWMTDDTNLERIALRLDQIRHYPILTPAMIKFLCKVDDRSYRAGMLGLNKSGVYKP